MTAMTIYLCLFLIQISCSGSHLHTEQNKVVYWNKRLSKVFHRVYFSAALQVLVLYKYAPQVLVLYALQVLVLYKYALQILVLYALQVLVLYKYALQVLVLYALQVLVLYKYALLVASLRDWPRRLSAVWIKSLLSAFSLWLISRRHCVVDRPYKSG